MKKANAAIIVLFSAIIMQSAASASFVMSIEGNSFLPNSGAQSLSVNIQANGSYQTDFLTAIFAVSNGADFTSPPGTYGQPGQVGEGNLHSASDFATFNENANSYLSLDFLIPQAIPTTLQELATVSFSTAGLSPGVYTVSFLDISAQNGSFGQEFIGMPASFTITSDVTAVPEPTSFALVGLAGVGALVWHRRQIKNRATTRATTS